MKETHRARQGVTNGEIPYLYASINPDPIFVKQFRPRFHNLGLTGRRETPHWKRRNNW